MEHKKIKILLVDDHAIVRHGLAALLSHEKDFCICGEAGSCAEGLAAVEKLCPDLALIDLTLKDGHGLDLIRDIRATNTEVKLLVLSMHDELDFAAKVLRAGAQGYVMKEHADAVIIPAMRQVLRGELYTNPSSSAALMRQLAQAGDEGGGGHGVDSLSDREKEIFICMGQGLTTRKMAEKFGLSGRTVEVHRANIKKKLRCDDAAQLIREAVKYVEQWNA